METKRKHMTVISENALASIRKNKKVKALLAIHFNKHYNTIENWIKNADAMLTTPDSVKIISQETGLTEGEILEREEETEAA
jgi:hypothetical protein